MRRRRLHGVLVAALAAAVTIGVAAPAAAEDLEDYLEKAAEAEYAGRRIVVTIWEGRSIAAITALEHAGKGMMAAASGTVIRSGRVAFEGVAGVELSGWSTSRLDARYRTGEATEMLRLGRPAYAVSVYEDDVVRARIVFDLETWAPLATEIYDGEGELFRYAAFMEFSPGVARPTASDYGYGYDLVARVEESSLPVVAGGYRRVDAYAGPSGSVHSFYSDGLFSFSVFEVAPRAAEERFRDAEVFELAGAEYLVLAEPSALWVKWRGRDAAYVLVGDLPPDHLRRVLADLPAPQPMSWLQRILGFFR